MDVDVQRLAKVLAMAASDNEAEAMHAVRTAKRLLDNAGMDFVSLASHLSGSGTMAPGRADDLEDMVFDLRNEIRTLRSENERLRQGHGAPAAPAPSPANLADAAQLTRLQMELAAARQALDRDRAEAESAQTALKGDLAQAIAALEGLTRQIEAMKGRNDRLEAENRRLTLMAGALKAELDDRIADTLHPLPQTQMAPIVVQSAPPVPPEQRRRQAPHAPSRARAKDAKPAKPANQYALF